MAGVLTAGLVEVLAEEDFAAEVFMGDFMADDFEGDFAVASFVAEVFLAGREDLLGFAGVSVAA